MWWGLSPVPTTLPSAVQSISRPDEWTLGGIGARSSDRASGVVPVALAVGLGWRAATVPLE